MATKICPWCQTEIIQEEGAETEKWCPVCENELDGYRTLTIDLERDEDDLEEEEISPAADMEWEIDKDLRERNGELLQFEEQADKLLDEQDNVPECPNCREYMLEAGVQTVPAGQFRPRLLEPSGQALLEAPFSVTFYICPSCFAVAQTLTDESRLELMRRISNSKL